VVVDERVLVEVRGDGFGGKERGIEEWVEESAFVFGRSPVGR
jgi:hypothetical protein